MSDEQELGSLIECLIDYRGKTPPKSANGIKLITAKVIKDGTIKEDRLEYISEETYATWMRRGFPRRGDILITTEAPLGEVAQLRSDEPIALAQRVILLRPDPDKVDPQYLFHFLRSPLANERLAQRASGTTVSGIRQPELRSVNVLLPDRSIQIRIGAILDAIDDLIENGRRQVALLDEMAQETYQEWLCTFGTRATQKNHSGSRPLGQYLSRGRSRTLAMNTSPCLVELHRVRTPVTGAVTSRGSTPERRTSSASSTRVSTSRKRVLRGRTPN